MKKNNRSNCIGKSIVFLIISFFHLPILYSQTPFVASAIYQDVPKGSYLESFKKPITTLPTKNYVFIDFVGTGDIQKSLSEGDGVNANTGLGIIFERYNGSIGSEFSKSKNIIQSFELEALINVASTADTINASFNNSLLENRRNFGTYIINPISQNQSLFVNANLYLGYPDSGFVGKISPYISGINARFITSNSVWGNQDGFRNLGAVSFRAGIFHEFIPDNFRINEEGRSKYSLFLGLNYAYRGVFGDITSDSNKVFFENILGTNETNYNGWELNFGFRLNNLRAEFEMPTLKAKNAQVEGLTNTQFIFSLKFVGGFSLKLDQLNSGYKKEE